MDVADRVPPAGLSAPLFGRSEIYDAILTSLDGVEAGTGELLLLVGEGGVGKSTLLARVVEDARKRGFRTVTGRALPVDLPPPFSLVQELLRTVPQSAATPAGDGGADAGYLSLFLAPYATDPSETGTREDRELEADHLLGYLAGPPARVEESRVIIFDRLCDYFLELSRGPPLLVAVDDLQFADSSSIEFLERLVRDAGSARIAVVATVVPSEEAPPGTTHLLGRLLAADRSARLTVRRMTEPEVAEYARWLLRGRDPGREAVLRWYTQTEGNPLFVEHLVRALEPFGPGGSAAAAADRAGPGDLEEIHRARLRALHEADRRVLMYATVLGKEFDFPTLAIAAGASEEERLAESVDRLVRDGLLREKGGEVYEFVSERIRAEAYGQLTETRRRILHRKVAHALEARGRTDRDSVFELARQFYLAREDGPAVLYNRRAAELAGRAFAHDTAIVYLERALESHRRSRRADPAVELHLMVELGRILDEAEEFLRSEEVLEEAVARARAGPGLDSPLALALLWLARTRSDLGRFSDARDLAEEAYGILERLGNRRGLLVAHRVLGVALWRLGQFSAAEAHQRQEIALSETEAEGPERGHALIDLANTLVSQGPARLDEALGLYEAAARMFTDSRDDTARARVFMNLALLHHGRGDRARGQESLDRALEAAERSHSPIWIGYCRLNRAQFLAEESRVPEARDSLGRAHAMLDPLGDRFAHQQLTMIEGMIREAEADLPGADAAYTEAELEAEALRLEAEGAEVKFRRARLAARRGEYALARRELAAAEAVGLARLKSDLAGEIERLTRTLAAAAASSDPESRSTR
ncbi:MAG: ATP-binding protein, partial [Thermoplasmata archaeon]